MLTEASLRPVILHRAAHVGLRQGEGSVHAWDAFRGGGFGVSARVRVARLCTCRRGDSPLPLDMRTKCALVSTDGGGKENDMWVSSEKKRKKKKRRKRRTHGTIIEHRRKAAMVQLDGCAAVCKRW